jgi:hypothetical protein
MSFTVNIDISAQPIESSTHSVDRLPLSGISVLVVGAGPAGQYPGSLLRSTFLCTGCAVLITCLHAFNYPHSNLPYGLFNEQILII